MHVEELVSYGSVGIFALGTTLNIIFIYMIRHGTRNGVSDAYKNLMTCFAICNIAFSTTGFIAKPSNHIHGTAQMTFCQGIFHRMKPWGFLWLCLFIGVYGLNTALLALHFVYRYIVVCRQQLSHIFQETSSVVIVILSVLSWGFIYSLITFVCFAANEDCYEYINPSFYEKFGEDLHNLSFVCVFTHKVEPNTTTIYWLPTIGMGLNFIMMIATFALMFFCGFKIYRTLKKSSMSQKSKVLQTQLLKAVAIQAIIPFFTTYLSRAVMYTNVIVGLPPLSFYAFTPLVISIYTVIDPVAIMFFVCDLRLIVNNLKRITHTILCL
ncbi:hypothetical protein V3C99_007293 [Haemonchus contortus]